MISRESKNFNKIGKKNKKRKQFFLFHTQPCWRSPQQKKWSGFCFFFVININSNFQSKIFMQKRKYPDLYLPIFSISFSRHNLFLLSNLQMEPLLLWYLHDTSQVLTSWLRLRSSSFSRSNLHPYWYIPSFLDPL